MEKQHNHFWSRLAKDRSLAYRPFDQHLTWQIFIKYWENLEPRHNISPSTFKDLKSYALRYRNDSDYVISPLTKLYYVIFGDNYYEEARDSRRMIYHNSVYNDMPAIIEVDEHHHHRDHHHHSSHTDEPDQQHHHHHHDTT